VLHDVDEAVLVSFDQFLEGARDVVADGNHQAHIGVTEGQLCAGLADRCHAEPPRD
jgi:hypothetical protein